MRGRVVRSAVVASFAAAVLALPCRVGAEEAGGVSSEGIKWDKVFDLAACALSVATIETGFGAAAAVITCGKAVTEWWIE